MFLRASRRALACLVAGGIFAVVSPSYADSKECIAKNNRALELRTGRSLLAARDEYRACTAVPGCPGVVRDECAAALTELVSVIPTLVVAVVDGERRDVVGASLTVDGKPVPLDGAAIEVDPGAHRLVAEHAGVRNELQVMATEGELNRRVELVLAPPPEVSKAAAPPQPAPSTEERSMMPSYVLAGVGAAGLASFTYFALSGKSEHSDLERCKPSCTEDDVNSVRTKYLIADVSLGVSVVAFGAAAYLLFVDKPSASKETAGVTWDIGASRQSAMASVRWVH